MSSHILFLFLGYSMLIGFILYSLENEHKMSIYIQILSKLSIFLIYACLNKSVGNKMIVCVCMFVCVFVLQNT